MKAIILAGGFGTRLQSVVKDVPKPMAMVCERPFLEYILDKLNSFKIDEVVLSVGYKQEIIIKHFRNKYKNINIIYSSEDAPLGTGGALKKALHFLDTDENILVLNGDTFYNLNIEKFYKKSLLNDMSISLKPMKNFNRYGSVQVDKKRVVAFQEKNFTKEGFINAGVYCINRNIFKNVQEDRFSFEDFLQHYKNINYYIEDSYFVDIGVPEDYEKAQTDLKDFF